MSSIENNDSGSAQVKFPELSSRSRSAHTTPPPGASKWAMPEQSNASGVHLRVSPPPAGNTQPIGINNPLRRSIPDYPQLSTSPLPSIWESRTPSTGGPTQPRIFPEVRRARAGTMPSRMTPIRTDNIQNQPLGSLALLSPDGNEVLWDTPTITLPQSPGNPLSSSLHPTHSSGSAPMHMASQNLNVSSGIDAPSSSGLVGRERSMSARTRSGSMSSLSNSAFKPFGPSIWNNQSAANSSAIISDQVTPSEDPMQPFFHELSKRSDPQRIRSYTLNTAAAFEPTPSIIPQSTHAIGSQIPSQLPQVGQGLPQSMGLAQGVTQTNAQDFLRAEQVQNSMGRNRAQTVGAYFSPPAAGIVLARYGKQHLVQHDLGDGPIVSLDDLSAVPTTTLWISNVPANATPYSLHTIFSNYGRLEAARVVSLKQCAYVTFANITAAMDAQRNTNECELYPGRGPSMVGFAKILSENGQSYNMAGATAGAPAVPTINSSAIPLQQQQQPLKTANIAGIPENAVQYLADLEASPSEVTDDVKMIKRALSYGKYQQEVNPPPEQQDRVYVSAVLRDVRKRIDNNQLSKQEVDEIALDMLPELAVLASDYMGNTVVQQLFDNANDDVKDMMLRELKPFLAQTGVHKNGTWAAQKIIDVARTGRQMSMIIEALRPYTVPLFLDQYGNYVIQGCLKFNAPWNDFIFESIIANMMDIAQGRFGARAIRACLESPHISRQQQRLIAASIIVHAPALATHANGSLLITWLLDTYTAPLRYTLLANRLVPHLVPMATSKLASLTLLKIITNRIDLNSSRMILDVLLDPTSEYPPESLALILADPVNGPTFLYKLLTSGFSENSLDSQVAINKIRMVLLQPNAVVPAHKRLLEETGLAMLVPNEQSYQDGSLSRGKDVPTGRNDLTSKMRSLRLQGGNDYGVYQSNHTGTQEPQQPQQWLGQF